MNITWKDHCKAMESAYSEGYADGTNRGLPGFQAWEHSHSKKMLDAFTFDESATHASERATLVKEVGECCGGSDPLCSGGCLVEKALKKRIKSQPQPSEDVEDESEIGTLAFQVEQLLSWFEGMNLDKECLHLKGGCYGIKAAVIATREALARHEGRGDCGCGETNTLKHCVKCGKLKPELRAAALSRFPTETAKAVSFIFGDKQQPAERATCRWAIKCHTLAGRLYIAECHCTKILHDLPDNCPNCGKPIEIKEQSE